MSHAGNPERFHEVNERFHNAIYAGSQNGYIAEMTLATRVRVQPFRRAQFRNLGRLAKSHAEHDRVVVAIMRGDKARRSGRDARPYRTGARGVRALRGVGVDLRHCLRQTQSVCARERSFASLAMTGLHPPPSPP